MIGHVTTEVMMDFKKATYDLSLKLPLQQHHLPRSHDRTSGTWQLACILQWLQCPTVTWWQLAMLIAVFWQKTAKNTDRICWSLNNRVIYWTTMWLVKKPGDLVYNYLKNGCEIEPVMECLDKQSQKLTIKILDSTVVIGQGLLVISKELKSIGIKSYRLLLYRRGL